jgi:DNA-binding protein HU-beta
MTKAELINTLRDQTNITFSKKEIDELLTALAATVRQTLEGGGTVEIPGIVRLKMADRKARTGRNPQTGAPIEIPARQVVKATVLKALGI